ncbi:MAG: hypothetical protein WBN92_03355 [Terriglobia bacterium]
MQPESNIGTPLTPNLAAPLYDHYKDKRAEQRHVHGGQSGPASTEPNAALSRDKKLAYREVQSPEETPAQDFLHRGCVADLKKFRSDHEL